MNIEHYKSKNEELARTCNYFKEIHTQECMRNNKLREELAEANRENMQLRVFMVKQMAKSMDMMMLGFENKPGNYHHKLDVNGFLERLIRYLSVESADSQNESFLSQTVHTIREAGKNIEASLAGISQLPDGNGVNVSSSASELSLPVDESVSSCESGSEEIPHDDDALPPITEEDSKVYSERRSNGGKFVYVLNNYLTMRQLKYKGRIFKILELIHCLTHF